MGWRKSSSSRPATKLSQYHKFKVQKSICHSCLLVFESDILHNQQMELHIVLEFVWTLFDWSTGPLPRLGSRLSSGVCPIISTGFSLLNTFIDSLKKRWEGASYKLIQSNMPKWKVVAHGKRASVLCDGQLSEIQLVCLDSIRTNGHKLSFNAFHSGAVWVLPRFLRAIWTNISPTPCLPHLWSH